MACLVFFFSHSSCSLRLSLLYLLVHTCFGLLALCLCCSGSRPSSGSSPLALPAFPSCQSHVPLAHTLLLNTSSCIFFPMTSALLSIKSSLPGRSQSACWSLLHTLLPPPLFPDPPYLFLFRQNLRPLHLRVLPALPPSCRLSLFHLSSNFQSNPVQLLFSLLFWPPRKPPALSPSTCISVSSHPWSLFAPCQCLCSAAAVQVHKTF